MFKTMIFGAVIPSPDSEGHVDIISMIDVIIDSNDYVSIRTGIAANVPEGYIMQISSRKSLAENWQVLVMNAPAIIHPNSSDEIKVILENRSIIPYKVKEGDAIAQVVLLPNFMLSMYPKTCAIQEDMCATRL